MQVGDSSFGSCVSSRSKKGWNNFKPVWKLYRELERVVWKCASRAFKCFMATHCGPDLLNFVEKKKNEKKSILLVIYSPAVCTVYHNGTTSRDVFLLSRQERTKKNKTIHLTNASLQRIQNESHWAIGNGSQWKSVLSHIAVAYGGRINLTTSTQGWCQSWGRTSGPSIMSAITRVDVFSYLPGFYYTVSSWWLSGGISRHEISLCLFLFIYDDVSAALCCAFQTSSLFGKAAKEPFEKASQWSKRWHGFEWRWIRTVWKLGLHDYGQNCNHDYFSQYWNHDY